MVNELNATRHWLEKQLEVKIPTCSKRRSTKRGDSVRVWRYDDALCCIKCHRYATTPGFQIGALLSHRSFTAIVCRDCIDAGFDVTELQTGE